MMDKRNKNKFEYSVYYPGGNDTAIISNIQNYTLLGISKKIMDSNSKIEQVGLILPKDCSFELQMMGGEFCVNGARSAASHWFRENKVSDIKFTISGFDGEIKANTKNGIISIFIPKTLLVKCSRVFDGHLVEMQGISYLVRSNRDVEEAALIRSYYNGAQAFGIITVERGEDKILKIEPVVWVKETNTLVKESACGSGSIAACVPFLLDKDRNEFMVKQPSGHVYEVAFADNSGDISLMGQVLYQGEKEFNID